MYTFVFIICVSLDVEGNLQRKVSDKSYDKNKVRY